MYTSIVQHVHIQTRSENSCLKFQSKELKRRIWQECTILLYFEAQHNTESCSVRLVWASYVKIRILLKCTYIRLLFISAGKKRNVPAKVDFSCSRKYAKQPAMTTTVPQDLLQHAIISFGDEFLPRTSDSDIRPVQPTNSSPELLTPKFSANVPPEFIPHTVSNTNQTNDLSDYYGIAAGNGGTLTTLSTWNSRIYQLM